MDHRDASHAMGYREPGSEEDAVASAVLAAAVEVHRALGPGFLEDAYARALEIELTERRVPFVRQPSFPVLYKGSAVGNLRPDLLVAERLVVELKTVEQLAAIHVAQTLAYLKATGLALALLINFNVPVLLRGVRRVVREGRTR